MEGLTKKEVSKRKFEKVFLWIVSVAILLFIVGILVTQPAEQLTLEQVMELLPVQTDAGEILRLQILKYCLIGSYMSAPVMVILSLRTLFRGFRINNNKHSDDVKNAVVDEWHKDDEWEHTDMWK